MNCPRCGAPDFTQICDACLLLTPAAIQEMEAVCRAIEARPTLPTADLIRLLEASGVLKVKDVQAILKGIFPTPDLYEKAALLSTVYERFHDALACLEDLLAREPSHASALMLKGDIHCFLNEIDQATGCYKRAQAARPDDSATTKKMDALTAYLKGAQKRYEKEPAQALEWCSQAVQLEPRNFKYLIAKGMVLWELTRHGEALVFLDQGLALAPRSASVDVQWAKFTALSALMLIADAQTLGRQILPQLPVGKRRESLEVYLGHEPPQITRSRIAGHWVAQAIGAQKERRFQDAVEYAYRATYVDPAEPSNKAFLGLSLVILSGTIQNQPMELDGLTRLMEALAVRRDHTTLFNYMQALHMTGRLTDALTVADELLAMTPDDPLVIKTADDIKKRIQ